MNYIALPTVRRPYTKAGEYNVRKKTTKGAPYSVYGIDTVVDSDTQEDIDSDTHKKTKKRVYYSVHLGKDGHLVKTLLQEGSRDYNRVAKWVERGYFPKQDSLVTVSTNSHALFDNHVGPYTPFSTRPYRVRKKRSDMPGFKHRLPSAIKTEEQVIVLLKEYAALQAAQNQ